MFKSIRKAVMKHPTASLALGVFLGASIPFTVNITGDFNFYVNMVEVGND